MKKLCNLTVNVQRLQRTPSLLYFLMLLRISRSRCRRKGKLETSVTPKPHRRNEVLPTPTLNVVVEMDVCPEETPPPPKLLGDIILPSPLCSKVVLPSEPTALCFAWHTSSVPGDLRVMKHDTISACTEATAAQKNSFLCTVFCRGIKTDELPVNNECDAEEALKKADGLKLCPGCGIEPVASGQCVKFGAAHFAKNWLVTRPDGKPCLRCKYTRKLVQNHMYRLKKKRSTSFKQRLARK
ncbi:hypothetical protein HPB51_008748 [Rhipicephalus microplus]|uniref:Uncharacterized protein n=1 Tax=Rhipicephalus microplus TaxID=6941 RepID=A0A9J6DFJ2_RHIMP|nr:hypothetical protein HPB51_008748 [Rhipicephalus microplus]